MATETTPAAGPAQKELPDEIRIVSHSSLFYWWPVWAVGFLMGIISLFSGYQMAAVPDGTIKAKVVGQPFKYSKIIKDKDGKEIESKKTKTAEEGWYILLDPVDKGEDINHPGVTVSPWKGPGVIFCMVLLVVIFITNIHLRGLWSLIVIVVLVSLVVILTLAGVMDSILSALRILDIRISTGGYFVVSAILLGLWLIVFFFFDPQIYMTFTPGQFRVRLEIGEGEIAYDTRGMQIQKVRSDFFRHWILGLGSGDLIVRTTGAHAHQFDLQNVLFLSRKVRIIEEMVRTQIQTSAN